MDYKKELDEIKGGVANDLGKLIKVLDIHLAQIPDDLMKEIAPIRSDISKVLNDAKAGNTDGINEVINKYANIHR